MYSQNDITRVTQYFQEDDTRSLRHASRDLQMKMTTIWRILRKELKWKSYRERHVQPLTDRHRAQRRTFCKKMEEMGEEFPKQIIFSDEKWFTPTRRTPESGLHASLTGSESEGSRGPRR